MTARDGPPGSSEPGCRGLLEQRANRLGDRPLSIVELGGSRQPMASAHGACHLTCNGEILSTGTRAGVRLPLLDRRRPVDDPGLVPRAGRRGACGPEGSAFLRPARSTGWGPLIRPRSAGNPSPLLQRRCEPGGLLLGNQGHWASRHSVGQGGHPQPRCLSQP